MDGLTGLFRRKSGVYRVVSRAISGWAKNCALGAGLALAALAATPAAANSAAADYFMSRIGRSAVPKVMSEDERAYYKDTFAAIRRQDWPRVQALFAQRSDGPLHGFARAEYFLAAGSPKIETDRLVAWLNAYPTLPQAEQIAALATRRGASALPILPAVQALYTQPNAVRRSRPRSIADGTMAAATAQAINDKIKINDPAGARALLDAADPALSAEARAEWRQKVAWAYYINNADNDAFLLAASIGDGSAPMSGSWVAEGALGGGACRMASQ